MDENKSLGTALPAEMARVREIIPVYDSVPMGFIAAGMMRADLDLAAKALAEGDVVAMLQTYHSLKEYSL